MRKAVLVAAAMFVLMLWAGWCFATPSLTISDPESNVIWFRYMNADPDPQYISGNVNWDGQTYHSDPLLLYVSALTETGYDYFLLDAYGLTFDGNGDFSLGITQETRWNWWNAAYWVGGAVLDGADAVSLKVYIQGWYGLGGPTWFSDTIYITLSPYTE